METLEQKAHEMAYGLGISVYIRNGRIFQNGSGIEVLPPENAKMRPHVVEEVEMMKGSPTAETPA